MGRRHPPDSDDAWDDVLGPEITGDAIVEEVLSLVFGGVSAGSARREGGAAVALAAGGFVSYLLSANAQEDLEQTCSVKRSCDDDKRSVRTLDAVALGAWIGAAGLAALSMVLWTSRPSNSGSTRQSTSIVARGSWLGMEGRF